jgi:hypothetical protein
MASRTAERIGIMSTELLSVPKSHAGLTRGSELMSRAMPVEAG